MSSIIHYFTLIALLTVAQPSTFASERIDKLVLRPAEITEIPGTLKLNAIIIEGAATSSPEYAAAAAFCSEYGIPLRPDGTLLRLRRTTSLGSEAYALRVDTRGIDITFSEIAGLRYALGLSGSLLDRNREIPFVQVKDRPALAMRGVFLDWRPIEASPSAVQRLKSLLKTLAQLRFNTVFIEFADNLQYDSQAFPQRAGKAFSKAQVREIITAARADGLEIIPYLQAFSHCGWMLSNPANARLLEDPSDNLWKTTWCPENPEVRKFFSDILRETIELFHPRYIHLGHDEIDHGAFRRCESCRKKQPEELLLNSIREWHDYLKEHNVRMIISHDQLMLPGMDKGDDNGSQIVCGWKILDQIPKDVIIMPWLYGQNQPQIKSMLKYFTDKGFKVIGAGFRTPRSIQYLAQELSVNPGSLGMLDTFWFMAKDWSRYQIAPITAAAISITAATAWNPKLNLNNLKWDPVISFTKPWINPGEPPADAVFRPLPLPASIRFGATSGEWPGKAFVGTGRILVANDAGNIYAWPAEQSLWAVSGGTDDGLPQNPPAMKINGKAEGLIFIHTTSTPSNLAELNHLGKGLTRPALGQYRVIYADDTETTLPLQYRFNITDCNSRWAPLVAENFYRNSAGDDAGIAFAGWNWRNPHPEKTIREIRLESAKYQGCAILTAAVIVWTKTTETIERCK